MSVGSSVPDAVTSSVGNTKSCQGPADPLSSIVPPAALDSTAGSGPSTRGPSSPSRVYSPSETANWLQCPVYRQFKKNWEPREVEWSPARLLGIAVQEGVNLHLWKQPDDAVEAKVQSVLEEGFVEQAKYTLEGLVKLALRGVEKVIDADLFNRHQILMVDEPLSSSRPDVVSRHETQGLGVTDFKVSQRIDERYRAQRLSSYDTDDQFWHYAWEVGETLGEPVKWIRPVVIILTPKATVLTEAITVTPERLKFWLEGAEQHWKDMSAEDNGERPIVPRWQGCRGGRFQCEALDFCHVFNRDPQRAEVYYERRH